MSNNEPKSNLEKHLMACINKTGCEGLDKPRSRAEELLQELADGIQGIAGGGTGSSGIEKITIEPGIDSLTILPNKYYVVDSQMAENIVVNLGESSSSFLDEYMLELRVDENPISIQFPNTVRWNTNENVEQITISNTNTQLNLAPKCTYLVSIANNIGIVANIINPSLSLITVTLSGSVLSWDAVENADYYKVYNGDTALSEMVTSLSFDLDSYFTELGEYKIKVIAYSKYYTDSEAMITYYVSTRLETPTNLVYSDAGVLSWDAVENADYYSIDYHTGFEGDMAYTTVTNNYVDLTTLEGVSSGSAVYLHLFACSNNPKVYNTSYSPDPEEGSFYLEYIIP